MANRQWVNNKIRIIKSGLSWKGTNSEIYGNIVCRKILCSVDMFLFQCIPIPCLWLTEFHPWLLFLQTQNLSPALKKSCDHLSRFHWFPSIAHVPCRCFYSFPEELQIRDHNTNKTAVHRKIDTSISIFIRIFYNHTGSLSCIRFYIP